MTAWLTFVLQWKALCPATALPTVAGRRGPGRDA